MRLKELNHSQRMNFLRSFTIEIFVNLSEKHVLQRNINAEKLKQKLSLEPSSEENNFREIIPEVIKEVPKTNIKTFEEPKKEISKINIKTPEENKEKVKEEKTEEKTEEKIIKRLGMPGYKSSILDLERGIVKKEEEFTPLQQKPIQQKPSQLQQTPKQPPKQPSLMRPSIASTQSVKPIQPMPLPSQRQRPIQQKPLQPQQSALMKPSIAQKPIQRPMQQTRPFQKPFQKQIRKPMQKPMQKPISRKFLRKPVQKQIVRSIKPEAQQAPKGFKIGKLDRLLNDPLIQSIECPGGNQNVLIKKYNKMTSSNIRLTKEEINQIITDFSMQAKIPIVGGILKAAVGDLLISAVVSEVVGSRFIINRITSRPDMRNVIK